MCDNVFNKREEVNFMGMKLSWHDYQLSISHEIKCLYHFIYI
jgi:hypothetical protein